MIRYFEAIERIIGHLAWPSIVLIIFFSFRREIVSLLKRLKSAEIKDVKFELEDKIEEIRKDAISNNVTMFYPLNTLEYEFNKNRDKPMELQVMDAWKRIESIVFQLDDRADKLKTITDSINYLTKTNKIEKYLAKLILDLRELRNITVHQENVQVPKEEYQNWISISKSVIDRLAGKL